MQQDIYSLRSAARVCCVYLYELNILSIRLLMNQSNWNYIFMGHILIPFESKFPLCKEAANERRGAARERERESFHATTRCLLPVHVKHICYLNNSFNSLREFRSIAALTRI